MRFVWPALCLFQAGLTVGVIVWSLPGNNQPDPVVESTLKEALADNPTDARAEANVAPNMDLGDEYLRHSKPGVALAIYGEIAAQDGYVEKNEIRRAICLEQLKRHSEAERVYKELGAKASNPIILQLARISRVRLWLQRGEQQLATTLLCQMLLRGDELGPAGSPLLADTSYLLGLSFARRANPTKSAIAIEFPTSAKLDFPDSKVASWLKMVDEDRPAAESLGEGIKLVRSFGDKADPGNIEMSVHVRNYPLIKLMTDLTEASDLELAVSESAHQLMEARSATVLSSSIQLSQLYDYLLDPLEVAWEVDQEGKLLVSTVAELPADNHLRYEIEMANRALLGSVLSFPEHDLSAVGLVELGNMAQLTGNLAAALGYYDRVIRESWGDHQITAFFNKAKILLREGELDAAKEQFYAVVDSDSGHDLTPLSLLFVGRVLLEQGKSRLAIEPLIRALSRLEKELRFVGASTLACAYLASANPHAANSVLMENRTAAANETDTGIAAFLSALARARARGSEQDIADLYRALPGVHGEAFFALFGWVLVAETYHELEITSKAVAEYQKVLPHLRHEGLRDRVLFRLASYRISQGNDADARQLLEIASRGNSEFALQSQLLIATLDLEQKKFAEAAKLAAAVVRSASDASATELAREGLKVLGRALQESGDYERAAQCFAGILPSNLSTLENY